MKKNRDQNVDIYRGIAILLVVVGHLYWTESIAALIYSFHLPLFFFVTGFFIKHSAKKYSFWEYLRSRFQNILVPYLLALAIYLLLVVAAKLKSESIVNIIFEFLQVFLLSSSAAIEEAKYQVYYWFMPLFFVYTIVLFGIYKFAQKYLVWIYVLCLSLAFFIYFVHNISQYKSDAVIWGIDKLPFLIPLGMLGSALWEKKANLLRNSHIKLLFCGLVLLTGIFYKSDLRILFITNIFLYFVLALNGSIFTILLSDFLDRNLSNGLYGLKKLIIFLGENSMLIYLVHGVIFPLWHGRMGSPEGYSTLFNITAIFMTIALTFVMRYFMDVLGFWITRLRSLGL